MTGTQGFYFLVGQARPARYGFVWRIWTGGTSFYIKPRWKALAHLKVSLHGPDPRPGLTPAYKLARDHAAPQPHYQVGTPDFLPCTFPGREIGHGLTHVVRIAVPGDTFTHASARLGPPAGEVRQGMSGGYIDIPPEGSFAALDLYVSKQGRANWPTRPVAEDQNAIAGEIANDAGQYLIGLTSHSTMKHEPLPDLLRTYDAGVDETEITRGIGAAVDPRGFVWLCERLMSEQKLRASN